MIVVNFAHVLTDAQRDAIAARVGAIERVVAVPTQLDLAVPLAAQVAALVDGVGLSQADWESPDLLVVPPRQADIAAALLAELVGRRGSFPSVVVLAPRHDGIRTTYDVADVLDLQRVRDSARGRRRPPA